MALSFQTTIALVAASATKIGLLQSPGAGAILLNGTAVNAAGVAVLDEARRILITSGSSDAGITFTVIGTNFAGNPLTETITGGVSSAYTTQDFLTVSKITHTGSVAGTLEVGTNGVASSPWYMPDRHLTPMNLGIGVTVTGTINFTVEYTYDDPNAPYSGTFPTAWPITALATKTANTDSSMTTPIFAIRLTQNSFSSTATAKMIVIQSGLGVQS